jgi:signal transduction histidine kinase
MKYKLNDILNGTHTKPSDGLDYMRERSFIYIVLITMAVGFITLAMSVSGALKEKNYLLLTVDITGYLTVFLIAFGGKIIPQKVRILSFVLLSLILGVAFVLIEGPYGAGILYFVAFNMLSAVFFGLSGTFMSVLTTTIILTVITVLLHAGFLEGAGINAYDTRQFILVSLNILFISSLAFVLNIIVGNLDRTVKHKERLRKLLHENMLNLSAAKKKAEESDKLKTSFLANMSHEIRTPMNAVLGFSDLVLNQPELSVDEAKFYVKTVYDNGQYLMNIIENILDVSLLDTHQLKIYKKDVSLKTLFRDLEILYASMVRENNDVKLKFKRVSRESLIYTDEQRLKQVLINLINNALKFTEKGEVSVGCECIEDKVKFYVKDTGEGIDEKDQEKIFDRFVKAGSNEMLSKEKGTGLGLSISKGIVEMLGGEIHVRSKKGEGAYFYIILPRK